MAAAPEDILEEAAEEAGIGASHDAPPRLNNNPAPPRLNNDDAPPSLHETAPKSPPPRELNRGLITFSIMAATVMQSIDATIANVALPKMQGMLSATQDEINWVLTSYIIAAAIMIPLTGWLAGRFGRKKVFLISIAGFAAASAACGASATLGQIVFFRLLQGVSGAALVPLSQAIMFDINEPKDYARAMAIWGVGVTMGPILGPALGGWLTQNYSWRWVFYINVPIGIAAFLGLTASMPETEPVDRRFDFFGFTTLSLFLAALQLMLDRGQLKDWFSSPEIITYACLGGIAFYLFIVHTLTDDRPFVGPALFAVHNFLASNIFIFLIGVVLFATLALLPPMLQTEMHYPVLTTGLVTAPRGLGTMLAMILVGRLSGRADMRAVMTAGLLLTVVSLWMMSDFDLLMDAGPVVFSGLLQGFGIGLSYVPLSTLAFSTLPAHLRNEGTAFFNLLRNIGAAIGISVVSFLLARNTQVVHAGMASHVTPYDLHAASFAAMHVDPSSAAGLEKLNAIITRQASMVGYIDDFKLMMVMMIVVIPLVLLLRRPQYAAAAETAVMD